MSLHTLPTELLTQIIHSLGADEFRRNIRLLTVTARWYSIALAMLIQDTKLTNVNLYRFPPKSEDLQKRFKSEMTRLTIQLAAREYDNPYIYERSTRDLERWKAWREQLNERLKSITLFTHDCDRLRAVNFQTSQEWDNERPYWTARVDHLYYSSMDLALARRAPEPRALTVLDIDMYAARVVDSGDERMMYRHICPLVARHLPTLRKLHVYTPRICPDVLELPASKEALPMRHLVVRLASRGPAGMLWNYSACCDGWSCNDIKEERQNILNAAVALSHVAPELQTARIMWYPVGYAERSLEKRPLRLHAIDCLTGDEGVLMDETDPYSSILRGESSGSGNGTAGEWSSIF